MKRLIALAMVALVSGFVSVAQARAGSLEGEIGENPSGTFLDSSEAPHLFQGNTSSSSNLEEMEKARLKSVDEKIRQAEQEGNRSVTVKKETASPADSGAKPKGTPAD